MLEHIHYIKSDVIYKDEEKILNKYMKIANEIFNLNIKNLSKDQNENELKYIYEIMKDDAFIYLLENINKLSFEVIKYSFII
jgi:hypothetical protein